MLEHGPLQSDYNRNIKYSQKPYKATLIGHSLEFRCHVIEHIGQQA